MWRSKITRSILESALNAPDPGDRRRKGGKLRSGSDCTLYIGRMTDSTSTGYHLAKREVVVVIAVAASWFTLCAVVVGQRRRLWTLEKEVNRQKASRDSEHSGRVNAEKELRAFMHSRVIADGGLFFAPIATVHSCFKECVGTPRQGQFAPSTRALLVFDKSSVSPVSLEGLESFSHVWVFWAFHLNTNTKDARAHTGIRADSRGHTFPAKVSPPFLKKRVGVFGTRTPHRPNPIGVSLCRVEEVTALERSVKLSGVDLVDGTPVLDIKPYVPEYDSPCPLASGPDNRGCSRTGWTNTSVVRVADWVGTSVKHRRAVEWAPDAELQLEKACGERKGSSGGKQAMRFFAGDVKKCKRAITESLSVDVRSLHKTRLARSAPCCTLLFDGLRVQFAASTTTTAKLLPTPTCQSSTNVSNADAGMADRLTVFGAGGLADSEQSGSCPTGDPGSTIEDSSEVFGAVQEEVGTVLGSGGGAVATQLQPVETVRVLSVVRDQN